jgi:hypothetical protein
MTKITIIMLTALLSFPIFSAPAQSQANTVAARGWFANPTPGNIWFYGEDEEWTISTSAIQPCIPSNETCIKFGLISSLFPTAGPGRHVRNAHRPLLDSREDATD